MFGCIHSWEKDAKGTYLAVSPALGTSQIVSHLSLFGNSAVQSDNDKVTLGLVSFFSAWTCDYRLIVRYYLYQLSQPPEQQESGKKQSFIFLPPILDPLIFIPKYLI